MTPLLISLLLAQQIQFEAVPNAIDFKLENFPSPAKFLPETMAGGLALFDYNNDGKIDIFFANGADLATGKKASNRLYRNDGKFRFTDVTEAAGLKGTGFAFGAAAADFDGDGHVDLFIPAFPNSQLFRNLGNGRFEDITSKSGLQSSKWPIAAAWLDYDQDGKLDLFIVNYLDWSPTNNPWCGDRAKDLRVYCHPSRFNPLANSLYRNLGNGRFEDVSKQTGIAPHSGKGMSAAVGPQGIFVTNDTLPNALFRYNKQGAFDQVALAAGVSLPDSGKPISAMGVDMRDLNNDSHDDIVITALARETFPYFQSDAKGQFTDVTDPTRLAALSARYSGWGIAIADLDNDGWKDIVTCNSHVNDQIEAISADRYKLPNAIFRNLNGRTFTSQALGDPRAHRGCALADLDNDGRLDLVVTVLGEKPEIWRNISPQANWLDIEAPLGTTVTIGNQTNTATSSVGYSSSSLTPIHFGLGSQKVVSLLITYPNNGPIEVRDTVQTNQRLKLAPIAPLK